MNNNSNNKNIKALNTTTLAFMGDAVYEVYIRKKVIASGQPSAHKLHYMAVGYVNAESQAKVIKSIFDDLSQEEQHLVKRARNRKSVTKPKNADPVSYKWATAFEALIGYLYLTGDIKRMEDIIQKAIDIVIGEE